MPPPSPAAVSARSGGERERDRDVEKARERERKTQVRLTSEREREREPERGRERGEGDGRKVDGPLSLSLFLSFSLYFPFSSHWKCVTALMWIPHGRPAVGVATGHVEDASAHLPAQFWPRRSKPSGSQRYTLSRDWAIGFPSGIIR